MKQVAIILGLIAVALSASVRTDVINEYLRDLWVPGSKVNSNEMHTVHIAIKQKDGAQQQCGNLLEKLADYTTPYYGQYLSREELRSVFVDKTHNLAVERFLRARHIPYTVSKVGDFITIKSTIKVIEQLFDADFWYFHSSIDDRVIKRTESYTIPDEIVAHVDFVSHTINFPPIKTNIIEAALPRQGGSVTPSLISQVYSIDNNVVATKAANQSLFESLGQDFSPADLTQFQQSFGVQQNAIAHVIGPNDPTQCTSNPDNCGEANLDVQYIMAVAQGSPTTYWSIDQNAADIFLDWILAVDSTAYPPLVHSMSYGSIAREEDSVNAVRFNTEVCKVGLRGLTIVVSSGDDGVANFLARNNQSACGFSPSFPATSPYVLAVGATQGPESGQPEIAASSATGGIVTTGGGFSYYFPTPTWQSAVVRNYLQNGPNLPPINLFNSTGRGYPDVAALGFNYNVVIGGQTYQESGTSASAPVVAGMLTLINGARLAAGKPALGWVNSQLYGFAATNPTIVNDITVGENNCCAGQPGQIVCCQYGFNATVGWDPLTGLGSLNFANLKKAFMSV